MTEQERLELEQLKQRQEQLLTRAELLGRDIQRLEQRLATPEPVVAPVMPPPPPPVPVPVPSRPLVGKLPMPPVIRPGIVPTSIHVEPIPVPKSPAPSPEAAAESVPAHTEAAPLPVPVTEPPPVPRPIPPRVTVPVLAQVAASPVAEPSRESSFEMRLGTYWFVRIGAVLVLTGLVFFGNLAYQKLGAPGKVGLLYLASGLLLGAGAWWQRKAAKETLQNYAQVLFAGGLAAVYFTTYAAHHFPNLRVIGSATTDGALLLAWAGFMVWIADRKKSELLALFSVGLAYYSAVITRVGTFTLWSNLVLASAAVFFLVRNRWAALSTVSLAATYASYTWWRFIHGMGWHWVSPDEGLWLGASFLIGYWAIFTAAVFCSKDERFAGQPRAGFLTLNNAAFFTLFVLTMWQVRTGKFWEFSLICGLVLLAMAALARRVLAGERFAINAYLTQGLLLVTIGIIAKFSGLNLALALGFESVALLSAGLLTRNLIFRIGSYITGALATGWALDALERSDRAALWGGIGIGGLLVFNAFTSRRADARKTETTLLASPAYFTALALVTWLFTTWTYTEQTQLGLAMAIEALSLTLVILVLPLPEIAVLGQVAILSAQVAWQFNVPQVISQYTALVLAIHGAVLLWLGSKRKLPLLQLGAFFAPVAALVWGIAGMERFAASGLLTGAALAGVMIGAMVLAHRQGRDADENVLRPAPAYFAVLTVLLAGVTTWFNTSSANCPLALVAVALVLTASIYVLRVRELPLLAQTLALAGHVFWQANLLDQGAPRWWNPLLMIAMTLGLGHWWQKQKRLRISGQIAQSMQLVWSLALVGLVMAWLGKTCSDPAWLGWASLLAVGVTAYAVATRAWMLAACAQLFLLPTLWLFYEQVGQGAEPRFATLAPIAALALLSFSTVGWFRQKSDTRTELSDPLLKLATGYRWVALAMSLWWVLEYIPKPHRIWLLTLLGLMLFLAAGAMRSREAQVASAVFSGAAMVLFELRSLFDLLEPGFVYLPNLLAVLVWLGQQRIARRQPARYGFHEVTHSAIILLGGLGLWLFVSRWVQQSASGLYLTASWSVLALALLTTGIVLRERMYRWLGLGVLAVSLGRVMIFDVWKLERHYVWLSFLALGIVLMVLGFIYNRYQEKIRQWL